MALYSIDLIDVTHNYFEVEAENMEEADEVFQNNLCTGEYDFSDGEVIDSDYSIRQERAKTLSADQLIELYFVEYPFSIGTQDVLQYVGTTSWTLLERYVLGQVSLDTMTEEKLSSCSFGMKELSKAYPESI